MSLKDDFLTVASVLLIDGHQVKKTKAEKNK